MTDRFTRTERKGVYFTERDQEIVRAVFSARYLTRFQIERRFFSPGASSSCKKRVRYLFDQGYLRKRRAFPNEPDVYFLGLRGRRFIAQGTDEWTQEDVDRIAGVEGEGEIMMGHELTLSELYIEAAILCESRGWTLRWKNTRMLELRELGIQPDAHLKITGEGFERKAFIEFTGVVPNDKELKEKLRGYKPLVEATRTPIIWLTTAPGKLLRLQRQITKWVYADYVLLGIVTREYLTKEIYHWTKSPFPIPFLGVGRSVVSSQPSPT